MKIEKLTENKIRIFLKNEDIKDKNIDIHSIMSKAVESQGLFLEMLNQAEKQVGFFTDGYKLLIEAYSSSDNDFVFTITKYLDESDQKSIVKNRVVTRRKNMNFDSANIAFSFENFDHFCELCSYLNSTDISIKCLARRTRLYEYNGTYYLFLNDVNSNNPTCVTVFSIISEFSKSCNYSEDFESKLLEYGNIIIPRNALFVGLRYFA